MNMKIDPDWLNASLIDDIKDMQEQGDDARQGITRMVNVRNAIYGNPGITAMSMVFWSHIMDN